MGTLNSTDKKQYRLWMMQFGIITILKLLRHFEQYEMYEECDKIVQMISEHNSEMGSDLETILSDETYDRVKEEFKKFNLTGNFIEQSTDTYVEYVLSEILRMELTN